MDGTGSISGRRLFDVEGALVTLVGGRSRSTGLLHFPRSPVCPYRGTDDVEDVPLPRTGSLWAWTTVTTAPPGYHGPVPYGMGVVELDADPHGQVLRVVGRLHTDDPDAVGTGDRMEVVLVHLPCGPDDGDELLDVWAFAPLDSSVDRSDDGSGRAPDGPARGADR